MAADQVVWSEQGRLHLSYKGKTASTTTLLIQGDIDEATYHASGIITGASGKMGIRVNDTVIIANSVEVVKAIVTVVNSDTITIAPYGATTITHGTGTNADKDCTILVYGSEYGKGKRYLEDDGSTASDSRDANEPQFKSFSNKPIIIKDYYEVSGSDTSRIGWVEVSGEEGQSGYLWYLKAEADTRARFTDYLEMAMIEGISGTPGSSNADVIVNGNGNSFGTEGLFAAIESRGNETSGVTGVNAATDLAEFDAILAEFDKQGAIEENMMFVNRATSLAMDDMLASMNSYGAGGLSLIHI